MSLALLYISFDVINSLNNLKNILNLLKMLKFQLKINKVNQFLFGSIEELPPCPTSRDAISNDLATFVADEGVEYWLSKGFHWGSAQCFRSVNPR